MRLHNHIAPAVALVLTATLCAAAANGQGQKPNIVILWGDDIGQSNLSAYTKGMMGTRTPNIDSIAKDAMIFIDDKAGKTVAINKFIGRRRIGAFGDSDGDLQMLQWTAAGGGLVTSTVLNLRDRGMGMPAAVVLWSPWADLTNAGDTAHTLQDADPTLNTVPLLQDSAPAHADGLELTDPRVSPLYAAFSKDFPPSLIVDGTKCIFLSTPVRLFQALEAAGQETKLDIYEGLWHAFQQVPIPETEVSIRKSAPWINKHIE